MQPRSSLCPGYTQVETFAPESEYVCRSRQHSILKSQVDGGGEDDREEGETEVEEEICYVTLDLGDTSIEPTLVPSSSAYRLIGLDTPTPFLQLHGTILKGRHDMLLGTELIFMDDKENHNFSKRPLVHVANTEQRIAFEEVTLIPKSQVSAALNVTPNTNVASQEDGNGIDALTGLAAPRTRTRRKKEAAATSSRTSSRKGKGKVKETSRKSAKARGKQKARYSDDEVNSDPEEDGVDYDEQDLDVQERELGTQEGQDSRHREIDSGMGGHGIEAGATLNEGGHDGDGNGPLEDMYMRMDVDVDIDPALRLPKP